MAHRAAPHKGIDAIAIAAFIKEVQKVVSREMLADDNALVAIGTHPWRPGVLARSPGELANVLIGVRKSA